MQDVADQNISRSLQRVAPNVLRGGAIISGQILHMVM